jgi:hypothetical protein
MINISCSIDKSRSFFIFNIIEDRKLKLVELCCNNKVFITFLVIIEYSVSIKFKK